MQARLPYLLLLAPLLASAPRLASAQTVVTSAPNLPTPGDISASWLYVGCYTDPLPASNSTAAHALSGSYLYSLDMTPVLCATFCARKGEALAGVQYATQCTCGNNLRSSAQLTSEANCDSPCSGQSAIKCGGTYHMNLFVNRGLLDTVASLSSAALTEATSLTRAVVVASSSIVRASSAVVASSSSASVATSATSSAAAGSSSTGIAAAASSSSVAAAAAAASAAAAAAAAAAAQGGISSGSDGGVSGGTIAGAVIGALAGLVLLGALLFFICRRRRHRQRQQRTSGFTGAGEKANGTGSAIALGAGGAWAQQGSGSSSEEGGTSAAYEKGGSGLHSELGGAHDAEAYPGGGPGAGSAFAGTALAGTGIAAAGRRSSSAVSLSNINDDDELHPHEMPYVLGPVIPASPLLGPGAGLLAATPTPSDSWRATAPYTTDDGDRPTQKESGRRSSMPLTHRDIYSPPLGPLPPAPDGHPGQRRSTEISRIVSPFADPPAPMVHARRSSTALSGNSFATAPLAGGGRRPSEGSTTSAIGGRASSVSKQTRKPVPSLVDGDAPALEQSQYYNAVGRKASDDSAVSSSAAELLGGAREMLKEDGVGLPSNEPSPSAGIGGGSGSGTKTPDLFKGWDGKQLRTLDVDEPLRQ